MLWCRVEEDILRDELDATSDRARQKRHRKISKNFWSETLDSEKGIPLDLKLWRHVCKTPALRSLNNLRSPHCSSHYFAPSRSSNYSRRVIKLTQPFISTGGKFLYSELVYFHSFINLLHLPAGFFSFLFLLFGAFVLPSYYSLPCWRNRWKYFMIVQHTTAVVTSSYNTERNNGRANEIWRGNDADDGRLEEREEC